MDDHYTVTRTSTPDTITKDITSYYPDAEKLSAPILPKSTDSLCQEARLYRSNSSMTFNLGVVLTFASIGCLVAGVTVASAGIGVLALGVFLAAYYIHQKSKKSFADAKNISQQDNTPTLGTKKTSTVPNYIMSSRAIAEGHLATARDQLKASQQQQPSPPPDQGKVVKASAKTLEPISEEYEIDIPATSVINRFLKLSTTEALAFLKNTNYDILSFLRSMDYKNLTKLYKTMTTEDIDALKAKMSDNNKEDFDYIQRNEYLDALSIKSLNPGGAGIRLPVNKSQIPRAPLLTIEERDKILRRAIGSFKKDKDLPEVPGLPDS